MQKLPLGVHIKLFPDSKLSELIYIGWFESAELTFLRKFLRNEDVFIDVGANIGLFTVLAARIVGDSGRVYSFEPCSKSFLRLKENIALNGYHNVSCHQTALSDRSGDATLTVSLDGFDAWNSLGKPSEGQSFATEVVDCCTLDEFAQDNELFERVQLMKIDVEGWEYFVLAGGKKLLSSEKAPILLVEFTDANCLQSGKTCEDVYRQLESCGYQMYEFNPSTNVLRGSPLQKGYAYSNLIAIKNLQIVTDRLAGKNVRT